jgi:ribosome-associated translation inhibitor RaiA
LSKVVLSVPVSDGSQFCLDVEADMDDQEGVELAATGHGVRARITAFSLASALDNVMPAIDTVVRKVRERRIAPDEVTLELGLKVGGEHGVILTKGTAEANLKLTVKWRSGLGGEPAEDETD